MKFKVTAKTEFSSFEQLFEDEHQAAATASTLTNNGWTEAKVTPYSPEQLEQEMNDTLNGAIDALNQMLDDGGEYDEADYNTNKPTVH